MGGAHEIAEKIEEVAHDEAGGHGHGSDNSGRYIGLTMALLGVMLAICSAMVGAERTELIKTMVEQSNVYDEYQAASTKYRVLNGTLQQVYAQTPSRHHGEEALHRVEQLQLPTEQQGVATLKKATLKEMMNLLQPRKSEIEHFLHTIARYEEERLAAKAWADAYHDEVQTHFHNSESFEKAQLVAEIGIVVASIALLLHNKKFWYVAIAAAVVCIGLIGTTWMHGHSQLHANEQKIEHAKEHYEALRSQKDANGKRLADAEDEELYAKIRERFGVTASVPAADHPEAPAPAHHLTLRRRIRGRGGWCVRTRSGARRWRGAAQLRWIPWPVLPLPLARAVWTARSPLSRVTSSLPHP